MQSTAATVDDYMAEVPNDRRSAIQVLRRLCRAYLTGFEESMQYGMPCYSRDGTVEVSFASQKNNIALYVLRKDVLDAHRDSLPASAIGKGCIRFRNPNTIDFALVQRLLAEMRASVGPVC